MFSCTMFNFYLPLGMQDQVLKSLVTPVEPSVQKSRSQGAGEEQAVAAPPAPSEEGKVS